MLSDDETQVLELPIEKSKPGYRAVLTDEALLFPAILRACWEYPVMQTTDDEQYNKLRFDE